LLPGQNVDPVVRPVLSALDQVELTTGERMEGMCDPNALSATLDSARS
jgi:hypothetical protein